MKISSVSKKVLASALSAAMVVAFAPTVAMGATTKVTTNTYYGGSTGAPATVEYYDAALAFEWAAKPHSIQTGTSGNNAVFGYGEAKSLVTLEDDAIVTSAIVDANAALADGEGYVKSGTDYVASGDAEAKAGVTYYTISAAHSVSAGDPFSENAFILDDGKYVPATGNNTTNATVNEFTFTATDTSAATALTVNLNGKKLLSKGTLAHTWGFTALGTGTIGTTGTGTGTFSEVAVGTADDAAEVTFDGGVYKSVKVAASSSVSIASGTFKAYDDQASRDALQAALQAADSAGITVKMGDDSDACTTDWDGNVIDGKWYKVAKVAATANGVNYDSVASAITGVTAGDTITLQADVTSEDTIAADKNVTIDLNGHKIDRATFDAVAGTEVVTFAGTGTLSGVTTTAGEKYAIAAGASVTVETAAKTAKLAKQDSYLPGTFAVYGELKVSYATGSATLNIAGGTADIADGAFGTVNVGSIDGATPGTFKAAKGTFGTVTVRKYSSAATKGGTYAKLDVKADAYATVDGGVFTADNGIAIDAGAASVVVSKAKYVATAAANKIASKWIADGAVTNQYGVDNAKLKMEVGAPVAIAQEVKLAADGVTKFAVETKCASLTGAAFNADTNNDSTVTLTADVEEDAVVSSDQNLTVDLAGHTVKGQISAASTATNKTVTIKGGSVIGYGKAAVAATAGNGSVVIADGTYTAEVKVDVDGTKHTPTVLTTATGTLKIAGGTFKGYKVNAAPKGITGGTFDKEPAAGLIADKYGVTKNADGTFTVELTGAAKSAFNAVNGIAKVYGVDALTTVDAGFTVADNDKALEAAVDAAYAKVLAAAWSVSPKATELAGFEFVKNEETGKYETAVEDLTGIAANQLSFKLVVKKNINKGVTAVADKDYSIEDGIHSVKVAVLGNGAVKGYLTGIAIDVTYVAPTAQDTANWTYGLVGGTNVSYNAEKKAYTFSTTSSTQFAVEKVSNSILELQEQMKQIEIAAQDKAAANTIKGTAKTIKTKKGVTAKKYTIKVKAVTSESGAVATYKKANTAGKSKITVAKSGTITIKKGLKKGTYKVKVKGTVGASSKTVTAKIVIK